MVLRLIRLVIFFHKLYGEMVTVDELRALVKKSDRALIFDADVEEQGTIKISTARGANLCSAVITDALERRAAKRAENKVFVCHVPGSGPTPFAKNAAFRIKRIREKEAAASSSEIEARKARRLSLDATRNDRLDARRERAQKSVNGSA